MTGRARCRLVRVVNRSLRRSSIFERTCARSDLLGLSTVTLSVRTARSRLNELQLGLTATVFVEVVTVGRRLSQ